MDQGYQKHWNQESTNTSGSVESQASKYDVKCTSTKSGGQNKVAMYTSVEIENRKAATYETAYLARNRKLNADAVSIFSYHATPITLKSHVTVKAQLN
jgi:hypothetical protein